jgi:glycosyltransferase involved in cell wall biosynthesis
LKLLFLNHNVAWSGTFFRAFPLGRALAAHGHEITVVTTSPTARIAQRRRRRDGVDLIETPDLFWGRGRTGWDPWNTLHRSFRLRHGDFDAIHAFDCRPAVILPALSLAARGDLPLFLDWADWWGRGGTIAERPGHLVNRLIGGVETWFEEAFRTRALGTTVISRALEGRAVQLGVPTDSILNFPNGCEHEGIRPHDRERSRAALNIDAKADVVLHVGLIYPRDIELLFGAMQQVCRERPRARLVLLGNPRTPIPRERLPADALITPGFVDLELLQLWLGAADCCVLPLSDTICNRGRWPAKLSDYLCAGRAVVMPRVGDAAEWIDAHRAGWTSAPAVASLAEALLAALDSGDRASEAGDRARRLAEGPLAWSAVAEGVDAFYRRIVLST